MGKFTATSYRRIECDELALDCAKNNFTMKITIIGTGYVGLVTGACFADLGNQVVCLDVDAEKIAKLKQGIIPIHEPGLSEMVARNAAAGRLQFSSDLAFAVEFGLLQVIAVGTPPYDDGSADLQYVLAAARNIASQMQEFKVVVNKSTVPVGTADTVRAEISAILQQRGLELDFAVVSNPEFLKEGAALDDFTHPDRIVIGLEDTASTPQVQQIMKQLYGPFLRDHDCIYWMDVRSAELTKYASNAMLATRISFMNEIARLAELVGADIEAVRHGMGSDKRIGGSFLYAGCGYGGSCFPKDVQALRATAQQFGQDLLILEAVEQVNRLQKQVLPNKIFTHFGRQLHGICLAVWGLAFKPETDDLREAPSLVLLRELVSHGAHVTVFDPVAMPAARQVLATELAAWGGLQNICFASDPMAALRDVDALLIVTEWSIFCSPDLPQMAQIMRQRIIFDGRNLFEPEKMRDAGFEYHAIGRKCGS